MSNLPQHVLVFRDGQDGVGIPVAGEKPDENKLYPPKPHTHVLADIPGLDDYIAGLIEGGELTVVGKSAYQSWLEQPGNAGKTEADFVASLKGKDGDAGKSAYEIWLTQSGNAGKSEADFLASLKGEKGADGAASNLDAYAKRSWVEEKIAEAELGAELGEPVDLSNFATKSWVEEQLDGMTVGAAFYGTVKTAVGNICSVEPLGSEGVTIVGCTINSVAPGVGDFVAINRQYDRWYGFVYRRATGETGLPPDVDPTSAIVTDITCGWECSGLVLDDGKLFLTGRGLADSTGHLPEVEHGVACASVVSGGPTIGFITQQGLLYTRANITDPIASAAFWKGALGRQVQNDYDGESYLKYGLVPLAQGVRKYACNQDGDGMLGAVGGIVIGRAGMAVVLADGTVMTCANFVQSTSGGVKFERHLGRVTGSGYDYDVLRPVPNIVAKDAALLIYYSRDAIHRGDLYIVAENGDVYASAPFSGSATAYEAMTIQTEFKAKSVAAGSRHVVFIDEDDDVWTYGYDNGFGQLGHSGAAGLQKIPAIKAKLAACGEYHTALIDLDDNLWTCGQNSHGQLCVAPARNSQIERNGVCFKVPDFKAATVACGSAHTLAIDLDGHAYSGGINNACQLGRDVASGNETTSNFGRIYLPS